MRRAFHALSHTVPSFVLRWLRVLAGWMGRGGRLLIVPISRPFDRLLAGLVESYPRVLDRALRQPALVLLITAALAVAAVGAGTQLGLDLIPSLSQGEFAYRVELPEGTPLQVADQALRGVQEGLEDEDAVESYSAIVGGAGLSLSATGTEGENVGRIDVRMKPESSPAQEEDVIARLRERLLRLPEARVEFERPSYFSFRTPVEVEVYGEQLETLNQVAAELRDELRVVPGLVDVRSSAELGNPELQVHFDREALARFDLDLTEVATTVRRKVRGEVATRFTEGDREIDILVRSSSGDDVRADEVERLIVAQKQGTPVYLSSVARISQELGPSEIRRIGQRRAAVISANLEGRSLGSAAREIREVLAGYQYPSNVVANLSGQEEERQRSFASLLMALALALFLVYLVMAAQFESLLHPFVILFTVPLGAIGAIGALALVGQAINVVVLIGAVMLGGIVVNNAIVLVDTVNQLRAEGFSKRRALVQAGRRRLRPILMTTGTTTLGLLPMALGLGAGAELRAPLAITVIGGLLAATLLTLVVIPVVYLLLDRRHEPATAAEAEAEDVAEGSREKVAAASAESARVSASSDASPVGS